MPRIVMEDEQNITVAPAESREARENQLIALAEGLAEKQIRRGTASAQVITHYLKLGTTKASLENEKIKRENELLKAKVETLQSQQHTEELYQQAIDAMRRYSGFGSEEVDIDDQDG